MKLPVFGRRTPPIDDPSWADGGGGVTRLLEWYAVEALSPDSATLSRIGGTVRAAFAASVTGREAGISWIPGAVDTHRADQAFEGEALRITRPHGVSWTRRRAVAAVRAVAILTLSTVGFAAAESGPGQPFYRLRLGIETVNLPPAGSQDRLAADLGRAGARLDDITREAAASNWSAASDASDAYRQVIDSVVLPTDAAARTRAVEQFAGQLARLEELRVDSQGSETSALDGAIAALCNLLGIPAPTAAATAKPGAGSTPSDRERDRATARPSTTGSGEGGGDGGRDRGRSPEPSVIGSDPSDRGGLRGPGSSDPSGDHLGSNATPSPKPTPDSSGSENQPQGPSMQPSVSH